MSRHEYHRLIEELCEGAQIDAVRRVQEEGWLRLDDKLIHIEYLEQKDRCRISTTFELPEGAAEKSLLRLMLELNFQNADGDFPVFSLHPDTGEIVLNLLYPLPYLMDVGLENVFDEQLAPLLEAWENVLEESEEWSSEESREAPAAEDDSDIHKFV